MSRPANLHRIAVLRHPEFMEECVLAISHGPVKGVVEAPWLTDDHFIAMMTFAKLGKGEVRIEAGRRFIVMPITDEPTAHQSLWSP